MTTTAALIELGAGQALIAITLLALPVAAISFARSGRLWQSLGKGPFAIEQELPRSRHPAMPEPAVDRELQATEARQMLEAKAFRQKRRGERPLDVDGEMARLLAPVAEPPPIDAELRAEVRQLVVARNERRIRRGEQPLDVEAETERQLTDL